MMNYIRNTVNAGLGMGLAALVSCSGSGMLSCSSPNIVPTSSPTKDSLDLKPGESLSYKEIQKIAGMSEDEQRSRDIWDKIFSREEEYKKVPSHVRNWRRSLTLRPDNPLEGKHRLVLVQLTYDSNKYMLTGSSGENAKSLGDRCVGMTEELSAKKIKIPEGGFSHYDIVFRHISKSDFWSKEIMEAAEKIDHNKDDIISPDELFHNHHCKR